MDFTVRSQSSEELYNVHAYLDGHAPVITCTCAAGQKGTYCKHRIALINGDDKDVVEATHSAEKLAAELAGSAIVTAMMEIKDLEKAADELKAKIKKSKNELARLMLGRA